MPVCGGGAAVALDGRGDAARRRRVVQGAGPIGRLVGGGRPIHGGLAGILRVEHDGHVDAGRRQPARVERNHLPAGPGRGAVGELQVQVPVLGGHTAEHRPPFERHDLRAGGGPLLQVTLHSPVERGVPDARVRRGAQRPLGGLREPDSPARAQRLPVEYRVAVVIDAQEHGHPEPKTLHPSRPDSRAGEDRSVRPREFEREELGVLSAVELALDAGNPARDRPAPSFEVLALPVSRGADGVGQAVDRRADPVHRSDHAIQKAHAANVSRPGTTVNPEPGATAVVSAVPTLLGRVKPSGARLQDSPA